MSEPSFFMGNQYRLPLAAIAAGVGRAIGGVAVAGIRRRRVRRTVGR